MPPTTSRRPIGVRCCCATQRLSQASLSASLAGCGTWLSCVPTWRARSLAEQLLALARSSQDAHLVFDAHTKLGQTCLHLADLAGARKHLEQALAPPLDATDGIRCRGLPRVAVYLAWVHWYSGFPTQALRSADEVIRLAGLVDSPHSSVFALGYASWVRFLCGDVERAVELAQRQAVLSRDHGLVYWRLLAEFTQGRAQVRAGDATAGMTAMRRAIDAMRTGGGQVGQPYLLCLLAQAQLSAGQAAEASTSLAAANTMAAHGNALYAAEALRLEGEALLVQGAGRLARGDAAQCFAAGLALAGRQGARAFELRAAMSLARLWARQGDAARAFKLLAPIHARFDEGFETEDLIAAAGLLEQLSR